MRERRGSVLLLSLMVMAVTLAVSVNLVLLINLGIGTATVSRESLKVFYQAESGLERAMYRVRQLKVLPSDLNMATDCSCGGSCVAIPGCIVSTSHQKGLAQPLTLKQDKSLEIDLIDPLGTPAAGIDRLEVDWADVPPSPPAGALVVTARLIAASNTWGTVEGQVTQEVDTSPNYASTNCAGVYCLNLNSANSYLVAIRAVKSDVTINAVRAKLGAAEKPLFDRLELTSAAQTSVLSPARQQLTVAMPGRLHASGLFDFALYSECGIDKATTPAHPCPAP